MEGKMWERLTFEKEIRYLSGEISSESSVITGTTVTFPSGESLSIAGGTTGPGEEYYDPHNSGNPLLYTGGSNMSKKLSKNFTVGEFIKSGRRRFDKARIDPGLVQCLQTIRDHVGKPVVITSGYRSYQYNIDLYKARKQKPTKSQHSSGRAADIKISGMTGVETAKAAIDACKCNISLGIGSSYIHLDVRGVFKVWKYGRVSNKQIEEVKRYHKERCKNGVTPIIPSTSSTSVIDMNDKLFIKHKGGGYHRYGGGRVDDRLKELRDNRLLEISDSDIDVLQRIANVESRGLIQGINSYDSAFMSLGLMQLTIKYTDKYYPDGKVQKLIQNAPEAFQRYGIELDPDRRYAIRYSEGKYYRPAAIRGTKKPDDLRSLGWAKRFYASGLDKHIIIEEVKLVLDIIEETKKRIVNHKKYKIGSAFLPHYEKSAVLRGLIQETFNNRPTYLLIALKRATIRAEKKGEVHTDQFLELVREAIREVYREKIPKNGPKKADNLIHKTGRLIL